jgi:hypothetical protein
MSESPKRGASRSLATRETPIRRIATRQIPTKPVVVAFFLLSVILVVWIGLACVQHHGLTREQCQHNKYYYWADGKCRAQGGPDPGPFG